MANLVDWYMNSEGLAVISDFTPPRSASIEDILDAGNLGGDYVFVSYNPGRVIRPDSIAVGHYIQTATTKRVVVGLATRDMNRLALGSHALGAHVLGVKNIVVMRGDAFIPKGDGDAVHDRMITPTGLMRMLKSFNLSDRESPRGMNRGTAFCVGSTINPSAPLEQEILLTLEKIDAGADFFITQPVYSVSTPLNFLEELNRAVGERTPIPIFWGVQLRVPGDIPISDSPVWVDEYVNEPNGGFFLAEKLLNDLYKAGIRGVYLIAPILEGGVRDYALAAQLIDCVN